MESRKIKKFRNVVIPAECNLSCDYCGGGSKNKIDSIKTIKNLEKVFNLFRTEEVFFRVECFGEITLYPDIIAYLEKKTGQGFAIEVLSNGLRALEVIKDDSQLKWVFSLDGHTVAMNKHRNLSAFQVQKILQAIIKFDAEVQCVYVDQTLEEMNSFIKWFCDHNYKGFLHIFPVRRINEPLRSYLDYRGLLKAKFIPNAEYFRRWKFIYENGMRNFSCDFAENGYVYIVHIDKITMIKCDCTNSWHKFEHPFGKERMYEEYPCGTCITHYEYNNRREFNQDRKSVPNIMYRSKLGSINNYLRGAARRLVR